MVDEFSAAQESATRDACYGDAGPDMSHASVRGTSCGVVPQHPGLEHGELPAGSQPDERGMYGGPSRRRPGARRALLGAAGVALACACVCAASWRSAGGRGAGGVTLLGGDAGALLKKLEARLDGAIAHISPSPPSSSPRAPTFAASGAGGGRGVAAWIAGGGSRRAVGGEGGSLSGDIGALDNLLGSSEGSRGKAAQQLQGGAQGAAQGVAAQGGEEMHGVEGETRADKVAELQKAEADAERPWGGAEGDAEGAMGAEARGRNTAVKTFIDKMDRQAATDGIENRNDVVVIGRLQKKFPYNVADLSTKFGYCAKGGEDLSVEEKQSCADHFVFLLLRRSLNQPACVEAPCPGTAPGAVRNPAFDTCLNPILSDSQVHDCLLKVTQIVES